MRLSIGFASGLASDPASTATSRDCESICTSRASQATVYLDASGAIAAQTGLSTANRRSPAKRSAGRGHFAAGRLGRFGECSSIFYADRERLPIEAALIARHFRPGLLRDDFGYRRWLDFDSRLEAQVIDEARGLARPAGESAAARIFGSDLDPAAIAAAAENAVRAGVAGDIRFQLANFENLEPPAQAGTIVINPPYDERLKVAGVGAFYRRIGRVLANRWRGYTAWVLAGNVEAAEQFDIKPSASLPLRNGPIDCRLLRFELGAPSGQRQQPRKIAGSSDRPAASVRSSPAEALRSRLARMGKHWARWARRQEITCYRVYDCDLPEVPWTIDRYDDRLHIVEHESPHGRSPLEHGEWFEQLVAIVAEALAVASG